MCGRAQPAGQLCTCSTDLRSAGRVYQVMGPVAPRARPSVRTPLAVMSGPISCQVVGDDSREEVVEGVVVVAAHDEGGAGEDGDAGVDVAADFAVGGVVRVPGEDEGEPAHDEPARDVPEEQGFEADAGDEGGDEYGVLDRPVAHGVAV